MKFTDKIKAFFATKKVKEEIPEKKLTLKEEAIDFFKDLVVILFIVIIIRSFIMVPFQISGHSMSDTFYDKEYIIVDKLSYLRVPFLGSITNPKIGDVIVFRPGVSRDKEFYIKRIIGAPGDTVKIEGGNVYVKQEGAEDFVKLDEGYLNINNAGATYVAGDPEEKIYVVPENSYFVMGDNRNGSTDSRECFHDCISHKTNFITRDDIEGIVFMDLGYFNLSKFGWKNDKNQSTGPKFFDIVRQYDYENL